MDADSESFDIGVSIAICLQYALPSDPRSTFLSTTATPNGHIVERGPQFAVHRFLREPSNLFLELNDEPRR